MAKYAVSVAITVEADSYNEAELLVVGHVDGLAEAEDVVIIDVEEIE